MDVFASASINHLTFNELDIGDYRTFYKLSPPLRREDDRQALIDALAAGLVDVVVSAHAPAPAEDKRLPFDEASPGAIGLETLLPALLTLAHEERAPLIDLIAAVTLKPAPEARRPRRRPPRAGLASPDLRPVRHRCPGDHRRPTSCSRNRRTPPSTAAACRARVKLTMVAGRIVHQL